MKGYSILTSLDTFQNPNSLKQSSNKQTEYSGMLNQSVIQISYLHTLLLCTEALVISWQFANCINVCTILQYRMSLHCRDRIDLWGWSCPYLTIYSTRCWYLYIQMNMIILLVSIIQNRLKHQCSSIIIRYYTIYMLYLYYYPMVYYINNFFK